jgi:hypothetical protein
MDAPSRAQMKRQAAMFLASLEREDGA